MSHSAWTASGAAVRMSMLAALCLIVASCDEPIKDDSGAAPTASVKITGAPADDVLVNGSSATLSAQALTSSGSPSGATVTWFGSNTTLLGVSTTGVVTALGAPGVAAVTASTDLVSSTLTLSTHTIVFNPAGALSTSLFNGGLVITGAAGLQAFHVGQYLYAVPSATTLLSSTVYNFGPVATTFASPVTVTMTYAGPGLTAANGTVKMAQLVSGSWVTVDGSSQNATAKTVTAQLTKTGTYALLVFAAGQ